MSNDINELRTTLFDTLRNLKSGTIDIEKARAINDTAQTIVNTAKVEVDYIRATGAVPDTTLIPRPARLPGSTSGEDKSPGLPNGVSVVARKPGVTVTQHKLKG